MPARRSNPHGDLATELALMVEYGSGPMAAIVDATSSAARNLDLDHDTGRLIPGHRADVIIVDGDPSEEIAALTRVRFVMSKGVVARDELGSKCVPPVVQA
jgi:imidazolonepropionase-like amidohydrolase